MNRLLVALLAAVDAAVAAVVGLGVVLVPLVLAWFTAFAGAEWVDLWPTAARVWQLGNLVPLHISLDEVFAADTGVASDATSFVVSLAPLAFAAFVLLFAAGSGRRAARAGDWITGVATGAATTAVIAVVVQLTSATPVAEVSAWQAVLFPTALYLAGSLAAAVATAWSEGDDGPIDLLHNRVDELPPEWRALPGLAVRGAAVALVGLVAVGGLAIVAALVTGGGQMIALFQTAQVDALGATGLTLAHLAYLPTLLVWAIAWVSGPGFAVGTGTVVSPSTVDLGVVPGLPLFGLLPQQGAPMLLLVVLLPVAIGALSGLAVRIRLTAEWRAEGFGDDEAEPWAPRLALAGGVAALTAGAVALLAVMSSGSIGPGSMADLGPHAGWLALFAGAEVLVGAALMLFAPRRRGWSEV